MKYLIILFAFLYTPNIISANEIISSNEELQQKIAEVVDFKIGNNIKLDSPRRFLQISILFTLSQNSNYAKISKKRGVSDDEISEYLNDKRDSFYKRLKISEQDYINYSIKHSAEIENFLQTNAQFAEVYEIIQSHVID